MPVSRASPLMRAFSFRSEPANEDHERRRKPSDIPSEPVRCLYKPHLAILQAMALASLATKPPADRSEAARERSARGKVTGRLKVALDEMIWKGTKRADAATAAKISEHSLYVALQKPHVKAYYLAQLEVLRLSERSRSLFRLTELRDQDDNKMVAFNAAKELAGGSADEQSGAQRQAMPGLVVVVNTVQRSVATSQPPLITVDDA